MAETEAKKQKMTGPLIGTHSGHFHADEALAVYMLRMLPDYASSPLLRSRDPERLAKCHTVVDVGGVYDDKALRFDHHQREFTTTFPGRATKLSSAGLVYMHMGRRIISQRVGLAEQDPDAELVFQKLYTDLIEAFDANDNGVSVLDPAALESAGLQPRFNDRGFSLASVVARMNHAADAAPGTDDGKTAETLQAEEDARFEIASAFAGGQFEHELLRAARSWLPARAVVAEAFAARTSHDPQGRILVLPYKKEGLPWAEHLYGLEADAPPGLSPVLYVLSPESPETPCPWRVRAVGVSKDSFASRKALPEQWRGVRDDALSQLSGIPGCVFVHASGFIGANQSFEGALKMAQASV